MWRRCVPPDVNKWSNHTEELSSLFPPYIRYIYTRDQNAFVSHGQSDQLPVSNASNITVVVLDEEIDPKRYIASYIDWNWYR